MEEDLRAMTALEKITELYIIRGTLNIGLQRVLFDLHTNFGIRLYPWWFLSAPMEGKPDFTRLSEEKVKSFLLDISSKVNANGQYLSDKGLEYKRGLEVLLALFE